MVVVLDHLLLSPDTSRRIGRPRTAAGLQVGVDVQVGPGGGRCCSEGRTGSSRQGRRGGLGPSHGGAEPGGQRVGALQPVGLM